MNKFRFTINALAVVIFTLAFASMAQAQATRTWVSGVGDDVNPCSRTAPCKTWAGAISKTATGGEIDALDPGGFGAVTITKSITLDGSGTFASTLSSGVQGIVINGAGVVARIRGLSISGAGTTLGTNGINLAQGSALYVENSVIDSYSSAGITVTNATDANLILRNVTIRNCGTGVNISPTGASATILAFDNVSITRSGNNLNIANGGRGVINRSFFGLSNGLAGNPSGSGINATQGGSATDIAVNESTIFSNTNGILVQQTAHVRIARCMIAGNGAGLAFLTGGIVDTGGNNTIIGNGGGDLPDPNGTIKVQK